MIFLNLNKNNEIFYCKRCINHIGCISVNIGKDGICNHCKNPHKYFVISITPEEKEKKRKILNKILDKIKNERDDRKYDCVVAFSGGKDSTYLLYLLSVNYGLNVLAVTVNTGYMNNIAFQNIKQTVDKLGINHIVIEPPFDVFTKLYKSLILNYNSNEVPLMKQICDNCTDMIDGIVINEAALRKIPYVFLGFSPDENARYFFEIPSEKVSHSWIPDHWESDFFNENERLWWWDPNKFDSDVIPRVLLPLHVLPYNENEIIETIEKKGLINKGKADPLKTNCILLWGIGMFDILRFGFHMYRVQISKLVRQGAGDRKLYLNIFNTLEPLLAKGIFNKSHINRFYDQISIPKEEMIELARVKRQLDPRREEIEYILKKKGISL